MPEVVIVAVALAAVVALMIVGGVLVGSLSDANFTERFPPISDAEFLALCTPGTTPAVALKVRRIVAKNLAVEYDRIHPSMSFIEDIGAD